MAYYDTSFLLSNSNIQEFSAFFFWKMRPNTLILFADDAEIVVLAIYTFILLVSDKNAKVSAQHE